ALGFESIPFLTSPEWFRHIFVWSGQWESLGWNTIIYLAALAGVNPELHEAARVDGATRLQMVLHINIPTIMPTIIILFILNMLNFMQLGFGQVLSMLYTLYPVMSDIIRTFVYETGILEGRYSFEAAIGLFESVINIIFLITVNQIARKVSDN